VALIEAEHTLNGTTTTEQRSNLLNQGGDMAPVSRLVRSH